MSAISIRDLNPAGADLLFDNETYLNELTDSELDFTQGGASPAVVTAVLAVSMTAAATYAITKAGVNLFQAIF
ncbi:hypothetical protein ACSQ6I_22865 [Anabaena sp. WFMT]|uniref:hypothetical protein n=1 Tax=Anabaena sp. WFMT TaxID=3449730 RepID=UPI003F2820DE